MKTRSAVAGAFSRRLHAAGLPVTPIAAQQIAVVFARLSGDELPHVVNVAVIERVRQEMI